jgi:hypothetical protein
MKWVWGMETGDRGISFRIPDVTCHMSYLCDMRHAEWAMTDPC